MKSFKETWNSFYPDILPIKWNFKYSLENYWFRIHNLPDSKRYADNFDEYQIILSRQNIIAQDILNSDDSYCVSIEYKVREKIKKNIKLPDIKNKLKYDFQVNEDESILLLYTIQVYWENNNYNNLLKDIADDELNHIFFINCKNGNIFAPYDGGVDLIIKNNEQKSEFKEKYKAWLSKHPEGL